MKNKFIYSPTKSLFEKKLAAGQIGEESIVFIEDTKEIWNRGHYFGMVESGSGIDPEVLSGIETAIATLQSDKADKSELSDYAKKNELPSLDGYLTKTVADSLYTTIAQYNALSQTVDNVNSDLQTFKNNVALTYATDQDVADAVAALVDSSPTTLNTLNELAAALGDDPNFATTVATNIGKKADQTALDSTNTNVANLTAKVNGNSVSKSGETLTVSINGSTQSLTNTNTKVTSAANHYTPTAESGSQLSVDASSSTAATWNSTSLVTGVNIQRDSKGHVTGVTVDSIKMPANPNTDTNTTYSAGTGLSLSGTTFSHADTNTNISTDTSYGPTANVTQSAKNTATFKVPQITLDQFGHVKSVTERTITVTDTDTNTTYSLGSFGITATAAELNYTDGVTSNIQTQLNGKQATISDLSTIRSNANNGNAAYGIIKTNGDGKSFLCNDGTYKKMYVEGETVEVTFVRNGVTPNDLSITVIVSDSNGETLYNNIHNSSETVTFNVPSGTTYTISCNTPGHYCNDFTTTSVNNYRRIVLINLYEMVDNGLYVYTQNKELLPLSDSTINKNIRDGICLGCYDGVLYDINVIEDTSWSLWGTEISTSSTSTLKVEKYADEAIAPVRSSIQPPNETSAYNINYNMAYTLYTEGYISSTCYLGYYYSRNNTYYFYTFPGNVSNNDTMSNFSGSATDTYSRPYIYMVPINKWEL